MTDQPFKLACTCGFDTESADDFVTHMLETGHGMSDDMRDAMADGGGVAEITKMFASLQTDPDGTIAKHGTPVDLDDEDLPPEVREAYEKVRQQIEQATPEETAELRRIARLPPGAELNLGSLRHRDQPYDVNVIGFKGQPHGEVRLYRRGEDVPAITVPITVEEIAMFIAQRNDLIGPFLDGLIAKIDGGTVQ